MGGGGCSSNLRPRAGFQHPTPSTLLCLKCCRGREAAPHPSTQDRPHPPPIGTPSELTARSAHGCSEPLCLSCHAQREGSSRRAAWSRARSRRQTDRHARGRRRPPCYSTLVRAEMSLLQTCGVLRSSRPCLPAAAAAAVERLMYEHLF